MERTLAKKIKQLIFISFLLFQHICIICISLSRFYICFPTVRTYGSDIFKENFFTHSNRRCRRQKSDWFRRFSSIKHVVSINTERPFYSVFNTFLTLPLSTSTSFSSTVQIISYVGSNGIVQQRHCQRSNTNLSAHCSQPKASQAMIQHLSLNPTTASKSLSSGQN